MWLSALPSHGARPDGGGHGELSRTWVETQNKEDCGKGICIARTDACDGFEVAESQEKFEMNLELF